MHDGPRTLHSVREDAFNYVWNSAINAALEVEPGAVVELHVRDASDEQIRADSGPEDVSRLDFDHVNPVSGPVFVKGAQPGDVLAVELLEFRPPDWGWTALIPGFGLLADEFPEPWLRISRVDGAAGRGAWSDEISLPHRPLPGTIGVGPDLMEAAKDAVRATIRRLDDEHGLGREEAYALCSVAVDLRIHELVDAPNWVVGAFLPGDIFEKGER